ncbi:MAG: HD domain-containing phosphohydrolase, partial [bacterium]
PLHDIGKVGIKDEILLKEDKLTGDEFEIMKMHTIIGGNIISELERKLKFRSFFTLGKEIAYHHHQRYDGTGYPNIFKNNIMLVEKGVGEPLSGEKIPLSARIVALADVYDALISKRCYKQPMLHDDAKKYVTEQSGKHFDPDVVAAFIRREREFIEVRQKFSK